jgi:hypothetical protein
MSEPNTQIDPELANLIQKCELIDAELATLSPDERKKRILAGFGLPPNASDEELKSCLEESVIGEIAMLSPEELAEWKQAIENSPFFSEAARAEMEAEGTSLEDLERGLVELTGGGCQCCKPSMIVELLVTGMEEVDGKTVFRATIPAIADTHKDSIPFTIPSTTFNSEDVEVLKHLAGPDGKLSQTVIFLGEANSFDHALFSQWKQEDFDTKLGLRNLMGSAII